MKLIAVGCIATAIAQSSLPCPAHGTESSADCVSDHDDTLLLQTKAVSHTLKKDAKNKRSFHRFSIHMQDDIVSMLQDGHTMHSEVYQLCAQDDSGLGDETTDDFEAKVDSCGNLTVTNELGQHGSIFGCTPESSAAGECYALVESADFFNKHFHRQEVVHIPYQDDNPEASDVFLFEIPAMDEISFLKAMNHIAQKVAGIPGAVVLFQGEGALRAQNHMHREERIVKIVMLMGFWTLHAGSWAGHAIADGTFGDQVSDFGNGVADAFEDFFR